jgi:oligopeptide transport system ATP-binding protein
VSALSVTDLVKHYRPSRDRTVRAVDGVSFALERGECLGLVGESGSGKSTVARTLVGLESADAGSIRLGDDELVGRNTRSWFALRRRIQMVFQDPGASLDPRRTAGQSVREPLDVHRLGTRAERRRRVDELLDEVGLGARHAGDYPHELSGGQRQRVGLARALALEPEVLVLDEPVSALDVSIQAQVLERLAELRERRGLTMLFIAHDLAVVRALCERVAVMLSGRIVESAARTALFAAPRHPYTRALLSAVPHPDPVLERGRERVVLAGEAPDPAALPPGCPFHPRCPDAPRVGRERCAAERPELLPVGADPGHAAACHDRP